MAVKQDKNMSSVQRRMLYGTNVLVMIVLAVALLLGVNLFMALAKDKAPALAARIDLSGGVGGHRLSERTRRILDKVDGELRITSVYAARTTDKERRKFFPKVRDLCEELRTYKPTVQVSHVVNPVEQDELRKRVENAFGPAAKQYQEVVQSANDLWNKLDQLLAPQQKMVDELLAQESWLSGFSTLGNIRAVLIQDLKKLQEARDKVEDLTKRQGLPRYEEANREIGTANDEIKRHLEQIEGWAREMNQLVDTLSNPEDEFVKTTREKLQEMTALSARLKQIVGDPQETAVSDDPAPILQEYAKAALKLGEWLIEEHQRVTAFSSKHPAIRQHPRWELRQQIFVMELPEMLAMTAEQLNANGRELRAALRENNVPIDTLQGYVRKLRQNAQRVDQMLSKWTESILAIFDESGKIDEPSRAFLAKGAGGELFKDVLTQMNNLGTKIRELPKLELDEIADRLGQDNILVVEKGDEVQVVTFDEVWPISDNSAMRAPDESGPARVFDGDSAIAGAVLKMTRDKPVAEVVFVTFEQEVPPQMRQFQRPMSGPMPMESITKLRARLEKMQFKVTSWNIAEKGKIEDRPAAEEGVPQVFVFLVPPPPPPMFQQQQQQQPQFGPEHVELAKAVLKEGGRGLFLALWMPSSPFMPADGYAWAPLVRDEWGVDVKQDLRVIRAEVDRKRPGRFAIDVVQWWYMQLSNFSDHVVGDPLRARRMLMKDVCPVVAAEKLPEQVTLSPILQVPSTSTDTWAEKDLERIFTVLQTGAEDSTFTRGENAVLPPFSVAVAAENASTKSKIAVLGMGLSLRDDYLEQRVIRFGGEGTRLSTDPPPLENADLFANAVYWLADRADMIAAGPAEVPVIAALGEHTRGRMIAVSMGWALAALALGAVMMIVRRK